MGNEVSSNKTTRALKFLKRFTLDSLLANYQDGLMKILFGFLICLFSTYGGAREMRHTFDLGHGASLSLRDINNDRETCAAKANPWDWDEPKSSHPSESSGGIRCVDVDAAKFGDTRWLTYVVSYASGPRGSGVATEDQWRKIWENTQKLDASGRKATAHASGLKFKEALANQIKTPLFKSLNLKDVTDPLLEPLKISGHYGFQVSAEAFRTPNQDNNHIIAMICVFAQDHAYAFILFSEKNLTDDKSPLKDLIEHIKIP